MRWTRSWSGAAAVAIVGTALLNPTSAPAEPLAVSQRVELSAGAFPAGSTLYFDLRAFQLVDGTTGPIRRLELGAQSGLAVNPQPVGGCIEITIPSNASAGDIQGGGTVVIPFTVFGVDNVGSDGSLTVTSGPANQAPAASCGSQLPENAAPRMATGQSSPIMLTGSTTIPLGTLVSDPDQQDQNSLTFTVLQPPAGSLTPASGAVGDLQYTAPAPNAQSQIVDAFTLEISDGNTHVGETPLRLTFSLGVSQNWTASPAAAVVTGGAGCTPSANGVACQVRPDARRLTVDLGSVVTAGAPGTVFSYAIELQGAAGAGGNLGTLTPAASGQFTKSPDGTVTGQTTVTYDYPEGLSTPVNLNYTITSGGFAAQGAVTVGFNPTQTLAALALTPNQRAVAQRIDFICPELGRQQETLNSGELQLLRQCGNLTNSGVTAASAIPGAMDSIAAEEVAAQKRSVTELSRDVSKTLASRTAALRGGATGISIAGLNLGVEGQGAMTALAEPWLNGMLGAGASADEQSPFSRLGIFVQGQFNQGDKDSSELESGFDFDTLGGMAGIDYRFRNDLVLGIAASYYASDVDFDGGASTLKADAVSASIYGSYYPTRAFYMDFLAGMGWNDYEQSRTVGYTFISGSQYSTRLRGSNSGTQGFVGLNSGYEFALGGFSIIPNVKAYYLNGSIDAYSERAVDTSAASCAPDCSAWDIELGEQDVASFTVSGGLQLAYTWNGKWGVLRPYVRADLVRELEDDGQVIVARLLNDNQVTGAIGSQTAPITITTEDPDTDYIVIGAGASLQLVRGLAGFFDYQWLEGYEGLTSAAYSLGLRYEVHF